MPNTYRVEIHHQGQVVSLDVPEDRTILDVATNDLKLDLPNSCNAGVCTTCAAKILAGSVEQVDVMGISPELREKGYALLCVSYPRSDVTLETEKEEVVYHLQFGQFQQQKK
jgi:ferredoxin